MGTVRRALMFTALLLVGGALFIAPARADSGPPYLAPQAPEAKAGTSLLVVGKRFPAVDSVTVETCGNIGLRGSQDCDQATAASTLPSPDGTFILTVTVGNPPVPCPCALVAIGPSLQRSVTTAFEVTGHPRGATAMPPPVAATNQGDVKISHVDLRRHGFWPAWFGGRQPATLSFTVENHGASPLTSPPVVLTVHRAATTTNVPPPELGVIPARGTRTYVVNVSLPDGLSYHEIIVRGQVGLQGADANFATTTRVIPWGLLLVVVVAAQLLLLYGRNRARGHLVPRPESPPPPRPRVSVAMGPFEDLVSLDILQYWALDSAAPRSTAEREPEVCTPLVTAPLRDGSLESLLLSARSPSSLAWSRPPPPRSLCR